MIKLLNFLQVSGFATLLLAIPASGQSSLDPAVSVQSPNVPATNRQFDFDAANARLAPINSSGVNARLFFSNDSKTLVVSGIATGLDPNRAYVSLVYNQGSVATGPQACLPTNNTVSWYQMVLAYWFPMGNSTRYLLAFKSAPPNSSLFSAFVPIDAVGTTSVRWDTQPNLPLPPTGQNAAQRFVLQACGVINDSN